MRARLCLAGGDFPYHKGGCPISGPILARCGKKRLLARECQSWLRISGSRQSISAWESSLLWRGFPARQNTHVLYEGTTLEAAEKHPFCIRARLYLCRKSMKI